MEGICHIVARPVGANWRGRSDPPRQFESDFTNRPDGGTDVICGAPEDLHYELEPMVEMEKMKGACCKSNVASDIFVGRYCLNADSAGAFTLPEDLRFMIGGDYRLVSHDGGFAIVPAQFSDGIKILFSQEGRFTMPRSVIRAKSIVLIGKLKYLEIG